MATTLFTANASILFPLILDMHQQKPRPRSLGSIMMAQKAMCLSMVVSNFIAQNFEVK
jgi:hypothetical protein